jgi:hypothetical protein
LAATLPATDLDGSPKFETHGADMSYREKSTWVLLVSLVLSHGWYFQWFLQDLNRPVAAYVAVYGVAVIGLAVMSAIGSVVIYWGSANDRPDERDRHIEDRSTRAAYMVHAVAIVLSLGVVFSQLMSAPDSAFARPIVVVHLFYGCFVLAEIVRFGLCAVNYRRSAA